MYTATLQTSAPQPPHPFVSKWAQPDRVLLRSTPTPVVRWSAACPEQRLLAALSDPKWEILRPILLDIERTDDGVVLSDSVFCLFGTGHTVDAAMRDYELTLLDYYDILEAGAQDKKPGRAHVLARLTAYVTRSDTV